MPAKLVVTARKGGSRISLLGSSGKELLSSTVFSEPRAKGATLRALKGLLGEVTIEDHTLAGPGRAKAPAEPATPVRRPGRPKGSASKASAAKSAAAAAPATTADITPVAEVTPAKKVRKVTAKRRATKASASAAPAPKATAARRQAAARIASNTAVARV